jgi:hypothetical protein
MIYFLRTITKNFILKYKDRSINELPIEMAPIVEDVAGADTLEGYIKEIVMKMGTDA